MNKKDRLQADYRQIVGFSSKAPVDRFLLRLSSDLHFKTLLVLPKRTKKYAKPRAQMSSATALNHILEKLKPKSILNGHRGSGDTVWKALEETDAVDSLVKGLQKYESSETESTEYYAEFTSLLNTILW